jgi:AcrR family transcriptional regulator
MGGDNTPPPAAEPDDKAPLTKRKKLRKEEIVAHATRLFAERGYEGTSMGDLAERVGLRKASLFHHFESKDLLYAAVLEELLRAVKGAVENAIGAEGSFVDRLDGLTDSITGLLGTDPYTARLLIREAMDWGPVVRDKLGPTIEDLLGASLAFMKAGQEAGIFNPSLGPEQLVVSLVGIHFIPFVIDRSVERFAGTSPFGGTFLEARRRAVREQVRTLVLSRPQVDGVA